MTSRAATDPVVYEHTLLSVRPPKGVTYKQVLHPKHVYFELVPNFKKSELVPFYHFTVNAGPVVIRTFCHHTAGDRLQS